MALFCRIAPLRSVLQSVVCKWAGQFGEWYMVWYMAKIHIAYICNRYMWPGGVTICGVQMGRAVWGMCFWHLSPASETWHSPASSIGTNFFTYLHILTEKVCKWITDFSGSVNPALAQPHSHYVHDVLTVSCCLSISSNCHFCDRIRSNGNRLFRNISYNDCAVYKSFEQFLNI